MSFQDRRDAGRQLSRALAGMDLVDPVVIGLPRGGVPVADEVAKTLGAPLDIIIVRKVGAPQNPEYGIGAIAEDFGGVMNTSEVRRIGISDQQLNDLVAQERREIERRRVQIRSGHPRVDVSGRTAIIVDDGLATGVTASVAVRALRDQGASTVILAVPVGAPASIEDLREEVDELICLLSPPEFRAVGSWYADFQPTTDEEVIAILRASQENDQAS